MDQWFFKITKYAEELLEGLDTLDRWPEKVKTMQANWIGKSEGCELWFDLSENSEIEFSANEKWEKLLKEAIATDQNGIDVFTTRPDTIFGASFLALSPDHPYAKWFGKNISEVEAFRAECAKIGTTEEAIATAPKLGIDTGLRVKHPFVEDKTLPVWIANFVLMGYGTGAVFGCPAHDQRDLDFARKYDLNVTPVVLPESEKAESYNVDSEAYTGEGTLFNSDFLNGLNKSDGIKAAITKIEEMKLGKGVTQYRLRDWGVSRQRYWGCPIPVIHCGDCGVIPVPEADLPVALPYDCLLYTSPSPRDATLSRMPSSA